MTREEFIAEQKYRERLDAATKEAYAKMEKARTDCYARIAKADSRIRLMKIAVAVLVVLSVLASFVGAKS